MENTHVCTEPKSNDFQDGKDAAGCWLEDGLHYEQIVGNSGVYLIVTDATGKVVRDDRPWQMTV